MFVFWYGHNRLAIRLATNNTDKKSRKISLANCPSGAVVIRLLGYLEKTAGNHIYCEILIELRLRMLGDALLFTNQELTEIVTGTRTIFYDFSQVSSAFVRDR